MPEGEAKPKQPRAKRLGRIAAAGLAATVGVVLLSGLVLAATAPPPRGRLVDIGESRRLRLVCEGPAEAARRVWFESGAYGFAADWGAVQPRLAAAGVRSCAYDRAGLGYSDPGTAPRDADAVAADLERLIEASGEAGPFVFVGHSFGGLYLRRFSGARPDLFTGLVLVDSMTPEGAQSPAFQRFAGSFQHVSTWLARAAAIGLFKPLAATPLADRIGLPPAARAEKRRAFGSGRHYRTAAAEMRAWRESQAQALAQPAYPPEWPVAVVTVLRDDADRTELVGAPARAARVGRVEEVAGAEHATLLGERYADRLVAAVRFVFEAAESARPAESAAG